MSKVINYKKIIIYQKYSNRRVAKKTVQLQSNLLLGGSATVKSPSKQFSYSKIALYTVHL